MKILRRIAIGLLAGLVLGLGVYVVARSIARPAPTRPWFAPLPGDHQPLVFAHQGGERLWPSNTLEAFRRAVALGADVLDSDVHLTRDGVLVLMHDETVNRTTDGGGAIRDLTLAEIKRLDAGYRFTTDRGATFPFRGRGLTVPALEELFQAFPEKRFGLEIKPATGDAPRKMAELIRRYHLEDRVLISSFGQPAMDAFRAVAPEVATSATVAEARTFFVLSWLGLVDAYTPPFQSLQIPERMGRLRIVTPRLVEHAHRRSLAVQPWTINETEAMKRLIALGVDGINTDRPDRLLELLTRSP